MLFRNDPAPALAISQPAHAWLSGQLLRAWAEPLVEPLLMAAEQHDIGWLDWETAPSFDPSTGRPHLLVTFSDTLSLALCGELATPLTLEAPDRSGSTRPIRLDRAGARFCLHPWPFRAHRLTLELEARPLPASGRFPDAETMRAWHAKPERTLLQVELVPGAATASAEPVLGFAPTGA